MELRLDELQKRIMVEWGLERGKRGRECDGWIRQQVDEEGTRVVNERVERNKEVCGKGVESQSEVRRLQEELRGAKERAAWERVKWEKERGELMAIIAGRASEGGEKEFGGKKREREKDCALPVDKQALGVGGSGKGLKEKRSGGGLEG
ncbi:hypothetical protein M0802_016506 [Mischocyttarus mexicanus]|nr:hypothetical protein M0802_016506 [Mischocyttarus mexicanus]